MATIEWYRDPRGVIPVQEFLKELNRTGRGRHATRIIHDLEDLIAQGFALGTQHLHKIRGDLWELRTNVERNPYRILFYDAGDETMVLLHAFHKKTDAIAASDIDTARRRMADHRERSQR